MRTLSYSVCGALGNFARDPAVSSVEVPSSCLTKKESADCRRGSPGVWIGPGSATQLARPDAQPETSSWIFSNQSFR
jgi:hypothetical protein